MLKTLIAAKDIPSVKFLEFTRVVSRKNHDLYVFFEGEDEKYYASRINNKRNDLKWYGISCKGKKNVLSVRSKIRSHPEYKTILAAFFVDADYDNNEHLSNFEDVFVTPCYSIENLYISDAVFDRIMRAEFNASPYNQDSECYSKAFELFKKTKSEYFECIKQFNKWIYLSKNIDNDDSHLNINNIKFDSLVKLSLNECVAVYDIKNHKSIFPELELPEASLNLDITLSPESDFRGKQHLEFIREFLLLLKADRCKKNDRTLFKERYIVRLGLTQGNCLSELSQYSDTPDSLFKFLTTIETRKAS